MGTSHIRHSLFSIFVEHVPSRSEYEGSFGMEQNDAFGYNCRKLSSYFSFTKNPFL